MENDLKSEASYIEDTLLDLLSEDDECIVLKRSSRKTAWNKQRPVADSRKKHLDKLQATTDKAKQCEINSNMLVDNGHRSLERVKQSPVRSPRQQQLVKVNGDSKRRPYSQKIKKKIEENDLYPVSEQSLVQMIKLSIGEKDEAILKTLVRQLRKFDEKAKSRILNKLTFDERLLVIKTLYSRPNKSTKIIATVVSPSIIRRHTAEKKLTDRNSQKSPPSNRVSFTPRRSFSYLDSIPNHSEKIREHSRALKPPKIEPNSKSMSIPSRSPVIRKSIPQKDDAHKMMNQINELQRQNSKLSSTINQLITKNYKLEQKLEVEQEDNPKMLDQMDNLVLCHDSIIDNIYAAYSQLTRRLKSFKFNRHITNTRSQSFSRAPSNEMNILGERASRIQARARSVSLSPVRSRNSSPIRATDLDTKKEIEGFMCNRKGELTQQYHSVDMKLDRIDKLLILEPVGSSLFKKYMLEKKILREHKDTLRKMIESI